MPGLFPHCHHRSEVPVPFPNYRDCRDGNFAPLLVSPQEAEAAVGGDVLGKREKQWNLVIAEGRAVKIADHKNLGHPVGRQLARVLESKAKDLLRRLVVVDQTAIRV